MFFSVFYEVFKKHRKKRISRTGPDALQGINVEKIRDLCNC